ncbi:MAG: ABC transporter substrate-binding protein [Candidatus Sumerlaeia bacterium]|nr:ABC transporter substrate-binding protein [Candidatus Sumerlaeia bacterium]
MKSILKSLRTAAAAAAAIAATALAAAQPSGEPIVFGVGAPLTGRSAAFGTQVRYGAEAAAKEINAKGGLLGRPFQVEIKDDSSTANEAAIVAQSFAGNPKVAAVIGHFNSDCSSAAKSIYSNAGIAMISPASTAVSITQGSDWVFRNIFNDRDQGYALADFVKKAVKKNKVAVLYENDTYGKGLRDDFLARAKELGLEVQSDLSYESDATDFRPLLQQVTRTKPEVLVVCGLYKSGGTISRQAREMRIASMLLGGDGMFDNELAKIGGKAAEGFFASAPFVMEGAGERAQKFSDTVKEQSGEPGNAWAALAYDAVMIAATAAERAGSADRKAIRDGIAAMNSPEIAFDGITGKTYFNEEGDTVKRVVFAQVQDGAFVLSPIQLPE